MKVRFTILPILVVFTLFSAVSCGGGADNPAGPEATATSAANAAGAGDSAAASGGANTVLARQRWSITDGCGDGLGIQARLWEAVGNRLTGRATRIFKTRSGGRISFTLLCNRGTSGCLGATTNPAGRGSWGVGINAERPRVNRAYCKACSSTSVSLRLSCGRRANDEGLVWDGALDDGLIGGDDEGLVTFEE